MSESGDDRDTATLALRSGSASATAVETPEHTERNLGPNFGKRYRVLGTLGKGGMGEVFRAYDTELKGEVALKVVREDQEESEQLIARFRREIALARKITSPNVLRIYDLAEHDGLRFVSMEYVDGEDLAARLKRERPGLPEALSLFRQVCIGVLAAHEQGIVHRDLKPQNVLLDKAGTVRVADFGLARSIGESGLTVTGALLGSPAYMSPEQVKGDPVDERSDIYSLGIMLFQLIAGRTPFQAATPHEVMSVRLHKKPPLLREVKPDAPAYLEAIVARCLELAPARRYASLQELLAELDAGNVPRRSRRRRAPFVIGAAVLAAAGAAAAIVFATAGRAPQAPRQVVAAPADAATKRANGPTAVVVHGFENRTGNPIFTETLDIMVEYALRRSAVLDPIAGYQLARLAGELANEPVPTGEVGARLAARDGVRVLELRGESVSKGAGYTIAMTVTDATTHEQVLAHTLDAASLDQVPPTIGRLASALRAAVGDPVAEAEQAITGLSSKLEANHAFAMGRGLGSANDSANAVRLLKQALALDPDFALAHVVLGIEYISAMQMTDAANQYRAVLKSIDSLGERDRLRFLGDYYMLVTYEYDRSIEAYESLLTKWPRDSSSLNNLAVAYSYQRDTKNAQRTGLRAAEAFPRNNTIRSNLISFHLAAGDCDRAVAEAHHVIAAFPRPLPFVYEYLALCELLANRAPEAEAALALLDKADASIAAAARADRAFAEGRLAEARRLLERGIDDDRAAKLTDGVELKQLMLAELALRRKDKAAAAAAAAQVATDPVRRFGAALVQLAAGDDRRALATAKQLGKSLAPDPRGQAKLLDAERLRLQGKAQDAVLAFEEANKISNTWLGHFLLARALFDVGHYAAAYSELKTCLARRGEVVLGQNDEPSLRYYPPLLYHLARTQEALGSDEAATTYRSFLALHPSADPDDTLVADARKRLSSLAPVE